MKLDFFCFPSEVKAIQRVVVRLEGLSDFWAWSFNQKGTFLSIQSITPLANPVRALNKLLSLMKQRIGDGCERSKPLPKWLSSSGDVLPMLLMLSSTFITVAARPIQPASVQPQGRICISLYLVLPS